MSLVPYSNDSLIIKDINDKSLMIVNPSLGKLSYFKQMPPPGNANSDRHTFSNKDIRARDEETISSYICPQCGTHVELTASDGNSQYPTTRQYRENDSTFTLPRRYFKLLQDNLTQQPLPGISQTSSDYSSFIPDDLFIPGYFHKFFTTLSLLGTGARGSVFKVVHRIGDTNLGVFALKKISIGNDMTWFNKCIREVKALSSLTHKSVNLITYNHVWLEMDKSYGVTGTGVDNEKIPCLFILQQYCEGGNLEDCILSDIFKKFPEKLSSEERKRQFRQNRRDKNHGKVRLGLSTVQILSIIRDVARGLHELHDIGIIHRDLKPSNLLLLSKYTPPNDVEIEISQDDELQTSDEFPTVVIGDLGESQLAGESRAGTGCTGTLEFTAPEVVITNPTTNSSETKYREYTFASDLYSLGMICYFIIFGDLPFDPEQDIPDMRRSVKRFRVSMQEMVALHEERHLNPIDYRIFELIESLLSYEPERRPKAKQVEEILNHILLEREEDNMYPLGRRSSITPIDEEFVENDTEVESENSDEGNNETENKLVLTTTNRYPQGGSDDELEIYTKYDFTPRHTDQPNDLKQKRVTRFLSGALCPIILLLEVVCALELIPEGYTSHYIIIFLSGISIQMTFRHQRLAIISVGIYLIARSLMS